MTFRQGHFQLELDNNVYQRVANMQTMHVIHVNLIYVKDSGTHKTQQTRQQQQKMHKHNCKHRMM